MLECIRCPKAYHKKCADDDKFVSKRISKRFMICNSHKVKEKE
jgi:hypothetical protein